MNEQAETVNILSAIANIQNAEEYKELNWEGSFDDYLKVVQDNPRVTRNAFQRIYDMILSHGVEEVVEHKKKYSRYRFFRDERHHGRDAVYGIDQSLNHLVDIFKPLRATTEPNAASFSFTVRWAAPRARSSGCSKKD